MRYLALACDYDGTLVSGERIDIKVMTALYRLRESGRKLILVTGRELEELLAEFGPIDLFDEAVLENGGVLYSPQTREIRLTGSPPPEAFAEGLRRRGVDPLSCGRVIVSTVRPHDLVAAGLIRELGLALDVVYNKNSVMIVPSGMNKRLGLMRVLEEFGYSASQVVGIGDAENDLDFLSCCGYSAAPANAVPQVKMLADIILKGANGSGTIELVERILESDPP